MSILVMLSCFTMVKLKITAAENYSSHLAKLAMHLSRRREAPIKNNNYPNRSEEDALQYGYISYAKKSADKNLMFESN